MLFIISNKLSLIISESYHVNVLIFLFVAESIHLVVTLVLFEPCNDLLYLVIRIPRCDSPLWTCPQEPLLHAFHIFLTAVGFIYTIVCSRSQNNHRCIVCVNNALKKLFSISVLLYNIIPAPYSFKHHIQEAHQIFLCKAPIQ